MNIHDFINKDQKLPESFIEKFKDKINWEYISQYQKLSENFIEKFKDKVNWQYISQYQKLSPKFIIKNIDRITKDIFNSKYYKNLPENIKLLLRLKVK